VFRAAFTLTELIFNGNLSPRAVVLKLGYACPGGLKEDNLRETRKHLTSIKTKHKKRLNLEPTLILALTKIRSRTEVLAYQKNKLNHLNNRSESH
jgi:hypothetical protein